MKKKLATLFILLLSICAVNAQQLTLNKIKAFTGSEIITLLDINKSMLEYIEQGIDINNKDLQNKIILGLIQDKLFEQTTAKFNIEISGEDLKNVIRNKIEDELETFPNEKEFISYLSKQGLTPETYFDKLYSQIKDSSEIKKRLAQEKFINSQIGGSIIVPQEHIYSKPDYSIILVKEQDEIIDILLKLRRGESFETLADKYSINKNTPGGRVGIKDINESLLAIEYYLVNMSHGSISGFFPVTSDNGADFYGYAVLKLNNRIKTDRKSILDELSQKEFHSKYSSLGPVNKEIINTKFNNYIEMKERRLFAIKLSALKNDLFKKIWDSGFVKIND